jgi:hypothetical protein
MSQRPQGKPSTSKTQAVVFTRSAMAPPGTMDIYRYPVADDLADLAHLCNRRGSHRSIVLVQLAISPATSGAENWTVIPVVELLRGDVIQHDGSVADSFVYKLATGMLVMNQTYVSSTQIVSSTRVYRDHVGPLFMDLSGPRYELHRYLSPGIVELYEEGLW